MCTVQVTSALLSRALLAQTTYQAVVALLLEKGFEVGLTEDLVGGVIKRVVGLCAGRLAK